MPDGTGYVIAAYALTWGVLLFYGVSLVLRVRAAARRVGGEGAAS